MPQVNRNEIFADDEIQVFHLVNRCVRRTFLCGKDDLTGRDFSHRKQWVRDRMEELAGIFGVEVLGFAVMSNHTIRSMVIAQKPARINTGLGSRFENF